MTYEIIFRIGYIVEDVNNPKEAYREALKMMKQDTHPEPYEWDCYYIEEEEKEK